MKMTVAKTIKLTDYERETLNKAFGVMYDLWSSLTEGESIELDSMSIDYDEVETTKNILYELSLSKNQNLIID